MTEGGKKPALVFLHGWTMQASIFDGVADLLSDRFDCHAPDLPGHGSQIGAPVLTMDAAADSVVGYLQAGGIEMPVLVGWSMGAMVAWNLARRHPAIALAGLAVIDMSPKIVNDDQWLLGIRNFEARQNRRTLAAMMADWDAYAARVNSGMYAAGNLAPHPETLAMIKSCDAAAMAAMWRSLSEADERQSLARLTAPTLVIKGARSRIYPPETGEYIAASARMGELAVMPQSGHSPHLEEPERFADILSDWIGRACRTYAPTSFASTSERP
jgi:pimeloyl-[acyl-carrier protein] methyl ester esterase